MRHALVALMACTLAHTASAASPLPPELPAGSPNQPVDALDLSRYAGTWHEAARLPMFFQRNCAADTTATYTLRDDGLVDVANRCTKADGGSLLAEGVARTTDRPAALDVRFAPSWLGWLPFVWADYWVIDLDPDYRWAVVGGPGQGALWFLSRDETIEPALFERLRQRAEARGYDLSELVVAD